MKSCLFVIFCFAGLALFGACEHTEPTAPTDNGGGSGGPEATLSTIQSSIFSQRCAVSGCHVPGTNAPMAMRSAQESFDALVNVASMQRPSIIRVAPNDPDNSYLIRKLEGGPNISGSRMPSSGSRLSNSQIDLIREWISNGAQNN